MTTDSRSRIFILGRITAASFVVLFQELTLIRWLPSQVRVTAYFPNLILIAAFLGLGAGCLRARGRSLLPIWPVTLLVLTVVAAAMRNVAFTEEAATEHLWLLYYDLPPGARTVSGIRLPILLLFILTAAAFVPLGQYVAQRLIDARRVATSLWGYAADLLGSFFGVVAFSAASFARTRPIVWFAIVFALSLLLYSRWRQIVVHAVCAALALLLVAGTDHARFYSPYYALSVVPFPPAFSVTTNGSLHQVAAPLRRDDSAMNDYVNAMRTGYHIPYGLLGRAPGRVLVLGAGTGNDAAVALDEGATRVDVVEIDPVILSLGQQHPDHPYRDRRVRIFNTDARAFLNHSKEQYDLVVFGTLDSMTRLSALSSVRLDNYVYTVECMRAVRERLAPGAGVVLYFAIKPRYIETRIGAAITDGIGTLPSILRRPFPTFNTIFFAGPAFEKLNHLKRPTSAEIETMRRDVDIPTDDWPYLYLQSRTIGPFYLSMIAAILIIAVAAVFAASPQMRSGNIDAVMFLFGLAFLLIETRLVTEMNLIWGATWLTSAVVFGSILATITLATILMELKPIGWGVASAGLIVTLLATWLIPARALVGLPPLQRLACSALFAGAPVFFASCCFALLFATREQPDIAFGWNMLGAVCGGLLEFSSMMIGIKAATLLAAAAYLIAFLLQRRVAVATRREFA
jgi:hypothetical protein